MNVQFTGRIIAVEPLQNGMSQQGQPWAAQNYVIEELNQQYPSRAVFQVYGTDKIQQFAIQSGEILTVNLGLKAHQSKDGRWFNQLDCWKVQRFNQQQPQPMPQQGYAPQPQQVQQPQGQVLQSQIGQQQTQQGNLPF